jgi:hypothetical protein
MTLQTLVILVVVGGIAGFLAEAVVKGRWRAGRFYRWVAFKCVWAVGRQRDYRRNNHRLHRCGASVAVIALRPAYLNHLAGFYSFTRRTRWMRVSASSSFNKDRGGRLSRLMKETALP